ncbi:MAG: thiol reductant ABC exporter subunit CydD [Candidatus Kryptoniota bacterium]
MNLNKELLARLNGVRLKFLIVIVSGLTASIFTVGQSRLLSLTIDMVFLKGKNLQNVSYLLLLYLGFSIAKASMLWYQRFSASSMVLRIKEDIREKLIDRIVNTSPVALRSERTGELINALWHGVDALDNYFSNFVPSIFFSMFIPILILAFVFPVDWLTGLILLATAPVIPVLMHLIGSVAEKLNRKQWAALSKMSAYFLDVLQGIETIKLFNRSKDETVRIYEVTDKFRIKTMQVLRVAFLSSLVLEMAATISTAVIAVEIGIRLLNGGIAFVDALFLLILAPEFYIPFRQLGANYHAGMEGVVAFERIKEIINNQAEERSNSISGKGAYEYTPDTPIVMENVSYRYTDRKKNALHNVSFTIAPNKVTALVGASGAGKSTIFNILLRFINPSNGTVRVGDRDLFNIDKFEWRKNLSWLPQQPYLFRGTIYENIAIAKDGATYTDVVEAAMKAHIDEFISTLPEGYNSRLGENASKLSGGQAQRIALARAFLRDAPFVLFDEPTANLDPQVEELLLNDMKNLFSGRTVLMIAHKLETINIADLVILLDNGRVIDWGNRNSIIKKIFNNFEKRGHFNQ